LRTIFVYRITLTFIKLLEKILDIEIKCLKILDLKIKYLICISCSMFSC